jgi:hypothetical protein
MAMIAGCPHILHLISSFAIKMLRDNAANPSSHLPREMTSLHVFLIIFVYSLIPKNSGACQTAPNGFARQGAAQRTNEPSTVDGPGK